MYHHDGSGKQPGQTTMQHTSPSITSEMDSPIQMLGHRRMHWSCRKASWIFKVVIPQVEHLPTQVCHVATQTPVEAAQQDGNVWEQVTRGRGRWSMPGEVFHGCCPTTPHSATATIHWKPPLRPSTPTAAAPLAGPGGVTDTGLSKAWHGSCEGLPRAGWAVFSRPCPQSLGVGHPPARLSQIYSFFYPYLEKAQGCVSSSHTKPCVPPWRHPDPSGWGRARGGGGGVKGGTGRETWKGKTRK